MRSTVILWSQQLVLIVAGWAMVAWGVAAAQDAEPSTADPPQAASSSRDLVTPAAEADDNASSPATPTLAEEPRPTPARRPTPSKKPIASPPASAEPAPEPAEPSGLRSPSVEQVSGPEPVAADSREPTTPEGSDDGGKLKPIPETAQLSETEIEAASFNGVTPGMTTMAEVAKAWGAPKEVNRQGMTVLQLYTVEPFDQVEASFVNDKVTSIVIRLAKAFPAAAVTEQLALGNIHPVLVSNDVGEVLGQAFPERGVMFAFEPSKEPGKASMNVTQIMLEPITAEPFMLRAETRLSTKYQESQKDLEHALKLAPGNARAHWLHSRVLVAMGESERAAAASEQAVRLEPANAQYRVTHAQVLGQVGRLSEAIREAEKAIESSGKRQHVKARALCVLGDLYSSGAKPDYRRALQYHTEAVTTADSLTASPHPAIRLGAKEVLVDAHLGAAHAIAWGAWKEKEVAVDRWLGRAEAFAADLVKSEGGNEEYRFRVCCRALGTCVGVRGKIDPSRWVSQTTRTGEQLIAATEDPVRKAQFQWELGMALYDALQIYQMRNEHDTALKYGEAAVAYLEPGSQQKSTPNKTYLVGRLYFRLGAIYAIRDQNHQKAVAWFDKAAPLLEKPLPKDALSDLGRHGETFVSMGVSYWESGQQEKAVEMTERGVELMQQAIKLGALDESALSVPYSNLGAMNRHLGQSEKATRFEQMAKRSKDSSPR